MVSAEGLKNVVTAGVVDGRGQTGVEVAETVTVGVAVRVGVEVRLEIVVGVSVFGNVGTDVNVEVEAGGEASGVSEDMLASIQPTGSMDRFVG